jgi:surfeit locus 1 family protein
MWLPLRHYRFDWKLTLLYVLVLPVLLRLGFWQLSREAEKEQLLEVYASRQFELPVPLSNLDATADLQYMQVEFSGAPDNDHLFLLDNRIDQGRVGYEVVQPVRSDEGMWVLVNRGWIAQGLSRADLPEIAPLPPRMNLRGTVYMQVGEPVVLSDELMSAGWPKVIQVLDPAGMQSAAALDGLTFPHTVRIAPGQSGALLTNWPVINLSPEMHRGYAVQWFAMSFMLTLLYLYYSTRRDTPVNTEL